ncbi:group II intron reverse transcriptase/maturase [Faecalicatena sp. AGMB00832]|uniref:Group II intron reverse transcriptase/maturase n=1 Tax=Faecalicatena faecalis TaxID=2726362 RepID=A0ABS6D413_9FIRM|nr:group II intron reverse transcriptase/maturase [Faecalicatena faecalis]MBU3875967.1 group II intron reverse transcriptase/maturase [Faecalicatena faecalis]
MSQLLEEILSRDNMRLAYKKVKANKGASGIDGITIEEIDDYLKENWVNIRDKIRKRKYKPKPVRRVEIPKPDGGVRNLGVPTVVDRIIEQAIVQRLTPIVEPHFSEYSYGFRPNRRAQQAILRLLEYFNDGYTYVVDIDLEKFFDNVPQDKLMTLVGKLIQDPDTESLIRKYLNAGVMVRGRYEETNKGTPQGGNLSPLLSNIMLNELDKELEARGLHFVRYADDCVIAVGSSAAANRVMHTITKWIEKKLGLKVNATKTKVTTPSKLKYLGFGFWKDAEGWKARPHKDSIKRFERKLKQLTKRSWSVSMDYRIEKLNQAIRGWINYFRMGSMKTVLTRIDEHLRTRMRIVIWKQWKKSPKRYWGLRRLGAPEWMARQSVGFGDHYQAVAKTTGLHLISKEILAKRGLLSCLDYYLN